MASIRRSRRLAGLPPMDTRAMMAAVSAPPLTTQNLDAAVGAPPAADEKVFPDAPATELVLSIRIPVRQFAPANAAEKATSIDNIRHLLGCVENANGRELKTMHAASLFNELVRQPLLIAMNVRFRETVINKLVEMEADLAGNADTPHYDDELADAIHEVHMLLGDISYHPWYVPA
jgi:hypothetical protein